MLKILISLNLKISKSILHCTGLEYYTGPIFEAELTFKVQNEKGVDIEFGSIGAVEDMMI